MQADIRARNIGPGADCRPCGRLRTPFSSRAKLTKISGTGGSCRATWQDFQRSCKEQVCWQHQWKSKMVQIAAALAIGCSCPYSALAAVQTVAPQDATSYARPLSQQSVNKGKVWLIFLAGATGLFGAAVAIEKNSRLFPAIAKANQAMAATKAAQKKKQEEDDKWEDVKASENRAEDAVLAGLEDARSRVKTEGKPEKQLKDTEGIRRETGNGSQPEDLRQDDERARAGAVDSH